jgi:uncharacterized membrane protein YfcA/uncharacterized membrane protein
MTHVILLALVGFAGGAFGSMVGLGGGIFIIPGLVLFLDVPVHNAIGASLLGVVATSTTSAAAYLRQDLSNVKLGMTLETMTVGGALAGGLVGAALSKTVLSAIFGAVMICVSVYMGVRQRVVKPPPVANEDVGLFGDSYEDTVTGEVVSYRVHRLPTGLGASLVAGLVSGLLGVGGGFLKVPVMVVAMKVPVRAGGGCHQQHDDRRDRLHQRRRVLHQGPRRPDRDGARRARRGCRCLPGIEAVTPGEKLGADSRARCGAVCARVADVAFVRRHQRAMSGLNHAIARVLRVGLFVSVGILFVGVVLAFARPGLSAVHVASIGSIPAEVGALHAGGFFTLGLLVLLATPIVRVAALLIGFLRKRMLLFVACTVVVLALLGLSLYLGLEA